jgi:hypothetical protein
VPDTAVARAELEARTEEALAWLRDPANRIAGPAGEFYADVAGSVAEALFSEFPFTFPLGRVVMAVAQALSAAQDGIEEQTGGAAVPADVLLSIAFLAAEKLDREEAAGHG